MPKYKILKQQIFESEGFSIVPIRFQDRYQIMKWRNEQMYHLRQKKLLTREEQDIYFEEVISKLFNQKKPNQILFSFLKERTCIGYGGLVHIDWQNKNAEISFVMDTSLENENFYFYWDMFLHLIERIAFKELRLYKVFTFAFDLRPHLYEAIEKANWLKEAILKEHVFFNGAYEDVIIHSKFNTSRID